MENPDYCLCQSVCLNYKEDGQTACRGCYFNSVFLDIYQQKIRENPDQLVKWECPMCLTLQKTKIQKGKVECPNCKSEVWISLPNQQNFSIAYK